MNNVKFINSPDFNRGATEMTALNLEQAVTQNLLMQQFSPDLNRGTTEVASLNLEQAVTQNLLIQQFFPAVSRKVNHMVFTSSEVTTDDVARSSRGAYVRALLPKLLDFMSSSASTAAGHSFDKPDLKRLWLEYTDLNKMLNNRISKETHLEAAFNSAIDSFQALFFPQLGIAPSIAGVLHCLQLELSTMKSKFASKITSPLVRDMLSHAAQLCFEANRHYPCICYVSDHVHHFQYVKDDQELNSSVALRAALEALTLIANFIVGIPHLVPLNDFVKRFSLLSHESGRVIARIVLFKTNAIGDDFLLLTLMLANNRHTKGVIEL
jgi:hypothetical protein